MKKLFWLIVLAIIAWAVFLISNYFKTAPPKAEVASNDIVVDEKEVVNNIDQDSHGCLLSAGFSWCEAKQKCLNEQIEPCKAWDDNGPLNATFMIEGKNITLHNGQFEEVVSNSASKMVTKVFGKPVYGQIGAGEDAAIMFLTQNDGGSGTFFYVVAAINRNNQWQGINAVYLGDRIAPQNINIIDGRAAVNYADRKKDEPFSVSPSVGITKYLIIKNGILQE